MAKPSFQRIVTRAPPSHEDVLTEVLALVIAVDDAAARSLLRELTPTITTAPLGIQTQRQTETGDRVDLTLSGNDYEVWIEIKKDSQQGDHQLERYAQALGAFRTPVAPGRRFLVYLTRPGQSSRAVRGLKHSLDPAEVGIGDVVDFDWQRLGRCLRQHSQEDSSRTTAALLEFMRDQGVLVKEIQADQLTTFSTFQDARNSLFALFSAVSDEVEKAGQTRGGRGWTPWQDDWGRRPRSLMRWNEFPHCWDAYRLPAWPNEIAIEWNFDKREDDREIELRFAVGLTFDQAFPREAWLGLHQIEDLGFEPYDDDFARLYNWMAATEVAACTTHDEQVRLVSTWVIHAFEQLAEVEPPSSAEAGA